MERPISHAMSPKAMVGHAFRWLRSAKVSRPRHGDELPQVPGITDCEKSELDPDLRAILDREEAVRLTLEREVEKLEKRFEALEDKVSNVVARLRAQLGEKISAYNQQIEALEETIEQLTCQLDETVVMANLMRERAIRVMQRQRVIFCFHIILLVVVFLTRRG
eukprot:Blabericola_migrator_1__12888@NODE_842_length_6289_cov_33_263742_g594_i0_p3_GENE_NODE_842_length_6289_cov_33_263742_g594_i0NODE_842_length_6289_cov_33_263742_g594_i0_p3_ORF_typecomplete_len164_score24_70Baculo_PEP_C/PF04513_12/1_4e05GAS/PF13851_6/2_7e05DUF4686/PF15742_5/0_00027NPV_P10/PF05531_12/0_00057Prominin/PF05478_11/0_00079FlxA/PF14282_6/0_001Apolipoprotein/PF01442_18/0_0015CCDC106/PF15794_5/9_3e02CCDC106/PF15794_5/0_0011DUF16/PF01519_16/0_0045BORCS6/PF10157_9/0_0029Tropomyosin_1/PF12718_7